MSQDSNREKHNQCERNRNFILRACRELTILDFMPIIITRRDNLGRFVKGENGQFGKKRPNVAIEKHSKLMKILWKSPEYRENMFTQEHRNNLSKANLGNKLTKTQKESISIATKNAMKDPKIRLKCRTSRLGKKLKPESIIKRDITRRNNGWYSPEGLEIRRQSARNTFSKIIVPLQDTKPEVIMQIALRLNEIIYKKHFCIFDGKGFFHKVDLFIKPNICIEVDGDYWHANPAKYRPEFILKGGMTAKEKWNYDAEINYKIQSLGYKMMRIWVSDILKDPQQCVKIIINEMNRKNTI